MMPINPTSVRRPASPVARTYTPVNGSKYKVADGDSWVSLAQRAKMNPWDLIRYNYPGLSTNQQAAAAEVNWYLQEYVGCTQITPDNRNYKFSSSATPGQVWLPSAPPQPPVESPEDAVKRQVLAALRDPVIARMNFGVGRFFIIANDYERVAKAIERGAITVGINPNFNNKAEYNWVANHIDVAPGGADPSLIIHECTHAIFDIQKRTSRVEESEGIAYVAQALFGRLKNGPSGRYIVSRDPAHPVQWLAWQAIFDQASIIAGLVTSNSGHPWVTEDQAAMLYWAIKNTGSAWYGARVGRDETDDGVPGS